MGKNDIIVVDNIVEQYLRRDETTSTERADVFQRLAIEFVLRHTNPTSEDIDEGIVDGANDGGIDGFFISINGSLIADLSSVMWPRSGIELEVWILTCKHQSTFKQAPLDNLHSSFVELMDFSVSNSELKGRYSDIVLSRRTNWMYAYRKTAHRLSSFIVNICYVSRGDTQHIGDSVNARSKQIESITRSCFGNCNVRFQFIGAAELIHLHRIPTSTPLRLKFQDALSQDDSYVMLVSIEEYLKFISSEDGNLRRYLFDSNVRDFMGANPVNADIRNSLRDNTAPEFWWLNNGITILASDASIIGKEISLEQIQIVNGLQTTESIFRHYQYSPESVNSGSALIKVVQSNDDRIRDAIIRSTNNQTSVESASLYATDKVQRDIEEVLKHHGFYYERRKNYYASRGYRQSEIVTPLYLGAGFVALGLRNPRRAFSFGNGSIQNKPTYKRVFGHGLNLNVWPIIAHLLKEIDKALGRFARKGKVRPRMVRNWRYVVAFVAASKILGTFNYSLDELTNMDVVEITPKLLDDIIQIISAVRQKGREERRWNHAELYNAGKAIANTYGVSGLDDWNSSRIPDVTGRTRPPVDLDFAMLVDRHLPTQPWKPGTHKVVAKKVGCSIRRCYDAIQFLVDEGIRNRQKDGVVYDSDGNVVDYDRERVDPSTLGLAEA